MASAIGYISTWIGLFKTLLEHREIMVKTIEKSTKSNSEKGDLIKSLSSVFQNPEELELRDRQDSEERNKKKSSLSLKNNLRGSPTMGFSVLGKDKIPPLDF